MKITANTVVTLRYKVSDALTQKLIDEGRNPMVYLHGGYENTFPRVEAALEGRESGFQTTLNLSAEDAFGARDESLMRTIPKSEFPPGVKVGGHLEGRNDRGEPQVYNVVKIKGPQVILDGNHPLAGKALKFSLTVTGVRAATEEEIAHRHVHGEHGHHH
jgi:FKBP-type peptidyl-prolyl cis-trans isomerase SlyD